MAADLGLVAHAAERDAHEVAARGSRDRSAERRLAHPGRADQAQDRAGQLVGALLHREILDNALLDLLQAEMVVVEDLLSVNEVLLDFALLVPRDRQQPVEIVAHDRGFRRHRRHLAELLELVRRLLARLLGELGLLDLVLELGELVAALLVAELLLDRLHLLVEVVFALGLLHLALDAGADALLDLQHRDLALHQAQHLLQPLAHRGGLEDALLVGDLHREMRGDGIGDAAVIVDLLHHADDLGRDLLVELHIAFELGHHRAGERLGLDAFADRILEAGRVGFVIVDAAGVLENFRALDALHQHLDGAVGQFQQLQHARQRADLEDGIGRRIVVGGVFLRRQQDEGIAAHHLFERANRLLPADEQRHDHVREHHDVAQRQHRVGPDFTGRERRAWFCRGHGPEFPCFAPPPGPARRDRSGVR